jgi:aldose 1-epimerase
LTSAGASGCFPLVPYSNRIGHCAFRWQGRDHRLAANFEGSPHVLHGVAWQRPWTVLSVDANQVTLQYRHTPDDRGPATDWPFAFDVSQRFALTEAGLSAHLAVTNRADQPQPAGLGWHPNFPLRAQARLDIDVSLRWDSDASKLPTRPVAQAGIHSAVSDLDVDNCFGGWQGAALIRDEALDVRLSASLPYLVVYTPPNLPFYAVEPVSHVNNAIQMADPAAHGLRTLAPGATFEAWMQIDIKEI